MNIDVFQQYFNRHSFEKKFQLSILLNFIFLISYLIFGHIKYEVSDDFIMQLLVSGGYTGKPSPEIVFMNICIGYILSFLYTYIPFINWYFWMQIVTIFTSCIMICYILLKFKDTFCMRFLVFIFLCFFTPDLYLLIQFTKTSTIALLAGCITFIYYLKDSKNKYFIVGSLFFLLGLSIRKQCINIIVPYFVLMILSYIFINREYIISIQIKKILMILIIIIAELSFLNITNSLYKNTHSNYQKYAEYNSMRSKVLDYPYYQYSDNADKLSNIGINENDYLNLIHWNFIDTEFFDVEKLNQVYEILDDYRESNPLGKKNSIIQLFNQEYWFYIGVLGCIVIFVIGIYKNKKYIFFSSIAIIGTGIVLFLYAYMGRLVYRVEFSTFLSLAMYLLFLQSFLEEIRKIKKEGLLIFVSICLILMTSLYRGNTENAFRNMFFSSKNITDKYSSQFNKDNIHNELKTEFQTHPEYLYFLGFQTMTQVYYLNYSPFDSARNIDFKNSVYISGIETNHPQWKENLSNWSIDNPAKGLLRDNVYLVENIDYEIIYDFLKNHYGNEIKMTLYKELNGFKIWKFTR